MINQPKPGPDYSGQNLSGRSFRGQDLRGAVFQKADLRGVDFREADLTRADFNGARMGKTWRRKLMELPVQFFLGIFSGVIVLLGVGIIGESIISFAKNTSTEVLTKVAAYYWALLPWMGLQIGFAWAVRRGRLEWIVAGVMIFVAVALTVALALALAVAGAGAVAVAGALALAGAGAHCH